jgi:hypothetical protein
MLSLKLAVSFYVSLCISLILNHQNKGKDANDVTFEVPLASTTAQALPSCPSPPPP